MGGAEDRQGSGILEVDASGTWVAVAVAPLLLLAVLLARPAIDGDWENHPAHFWLVLGAAIAATALGLSVTTAARRRQ